MYRVHRTSIPRDASWFLPEMISCIPSGKRRRNTVKTTSSFTASGCIILPSPLHLGQPWTIFMGADVLEPPQEYPYVPGYYAVFFRDPDGMKLEYVYIPT